MSGEFEDYLNDSSHEYEKLVNEVGKGCGASMPFKIGDVVTFKGGAQFPLNVINVNVVYPTVMVAWFCGHGSFNSQELPSACLQKYKPDFRVDGIATPDEYNDLFGGSE